MNERETKQVIVIRKDLKMRRGKEIAQGSHASLGAVLWIQEAIRNKFRGDEWKEPYHTWLAASFKKICLVVNSEAELLAVHTAASEAHIPLKLITDLGHTEFHGVPTVTCLAIGPYWSDEIDKITGGLTLY